MAATVCFGESHICLRRLYGRQFFDHFVLNHHLILEIAGNINSTLRGGLRTFLIVFSEPLSLQNSNFLPKSSEIPIEENV